MEELYISTLKELFLEIYNNHPNCELQGLADGLKSSIKVKLQKDEDFHSYNHRINSIGKKIVDFLSGTQYELVIVHRIEYSTINLYYKDNIINYLNFYL